MLGLTATALTDSQSFRALRRAGALVLGSNASLTSTAGLASLAGLGDLVLENNPALTTIAAQPNLTALDGSVAVRTGTPAHQPRRVQPGDAIGRSVTIARNAALRNVSGMERLVLIERDLVINDNAVLDSLAGFRAPRRRRRRADHLGQSAAARRRADQPAHADRALTPPGGE